MPISLYELSVPTLLQTVRAVGGCLDRAARHAAEIGTDPDDWVEARLVHDMAPLHFQIEALTHHAVWGLEAVRTSVFAPPPLVGAMPFGALQAMISRAAETLEALDPEEVERWSGRGFDIELYRPVDEAQHVRSNWAPRRLSFTAETFLLSYSLPNVHFHAATAYAILRLNGVPLGKRDYEGQLRVRPD